MVCLFSQVARLARLISRWRWKRQIPLRHQEARVDIPPIFRSRLYLKASELLSFLPFSRRTLGRMESQGRFPAAVALSAGIKAWRTDEVIRWVNERNGTSS
jgi:predicted DNA-binding transcriptional regulator AlpA